MVKDEKTSKTGAEKSAKKSEKSIEKSSKKQDKENEKALKKELKEKDDAIKKELKEKEDAIKREQKKEEQEKILSHRYNPMKFELLDEAESDALFEELKVSSGLELPKISITDPICKIYKAKPNEIFKITRNSYTSKESVFYRVVIDE